MLERNVLGSNPRVGGKDAGLNRQWRGSEGQCGKGNVMTNKLSLELYMSYPVCVWHGVWGMSTGG
jgi:hypothetical protein